MRKVLLMTVLLAGTWLNLAAGELNLLCIGNSFTRNATKYLPDIVKTFPDCKLNLCIVYFGGSNLEYHWYRVEATEKDPSLVFWKRNGVHATFKDLLAAEKWDVVVPIQQYGGPDAFSEAQCEPYATNLYNYVKKYSPNSKIMIHQTWAYRPDYGPLRAWAGGGYKGMYDVTYACYERMAKKFNVELLPSGAAMKLCQERHPFTPDPNFNYKKVDPKAPVESWPKEQWSMHTGPTVLPHRADKPFVIDYEHASPRGEYLMSCLWFEKLYGKDASTITFKPDILTDEEAKELRNLAHETATTFVQPKDAK